LLAAAVINPARGTAPPEKIVWSSLAATYELFIAAPDGSNEHPFFPGSGSSYNASFSWDGRWIVFTAERSGSPDIFRAHPDGSGLERLTDSPAFDDQGALSPDGRTLAFVSTRDGGRANIWLLDIPTHRAVNLTKSPAGNFRPSWSPEGTWIAFSSDRDTERTRYLRANGAQAWELMQLTALYIVHPDGSGLRRLTPLGQFAGSPKWSRDGRRLVYYQVTDVERMRHGSGIVTQIISMDLDGGARQVHTDGRSRAASPQYVTETEIGYTVTERVEGKRQSSLAYTSGRKGPTNAESPSWSPDGALVIYHRGDRIKHGWVDFQPSRDSRYELIGGTPFSADFVAFNATGEQFVYPSGQPYSQLNLAAWDPGSSRIIFDAGEGKREIGSVALSPDGRNVALQIGVNFRRPVEPSQIALMASDGSGMRIVTHGSDSNAGFPSYSPDGRQLVYRVLGSEQGLRILSLSDGKVRKLTGGWDDFPTWSPRGDRIAFTGFQSGDFEIYTIRPDGGALRQLTHTRGNDSHPVWSPDGRWLAFVSSRTGSKDEYLYAREAQSYGEIFAMRADGTDLRQLTDNQWEELALAWLPATSGAPGPGATVAAVRPR
jgi:Tol biopolymer transport system component